MSPRSWLYALREAVASMTRNTMMSLASTATVALSLLVLSVVMILALNLQHMAGSLVGQLEVKVFLKETVKPADGQAVLKQIQSMPAVLSATYVTKDEALAQMRQEFGDQAPILDALDKNPLLDSIDVKAKDVNNVSNLANQLRTLQGVNDVSDGKDTVSKLLAVTKAIRIGGLSLVGLLLIATIFTISNTIRLAVYARRREIAIMKMVGATDSFIRRPFMLEGIFLGGLGSGLAMLATGLGYGRVVGFIHGNLPFLPVLDSSTVLGPLTVSLLLLGAVMGAVGSILSLRRYLNV